ncbi:lysophospholipid acyltransferase family protein [Rapidithrix thailandica]|uniref:Lysophospholipid acyltransferase family protein n=1 Tax=Rapidithrix thailandica TaxID=413964 RepID=A0AAW9S1H8_9BACT
MKLIKAMIHWVRSLLEQDPFGNYLLIKRFAISVLGIVTYPRLAITNHLKVEGTEHLEGLPDNNVLFLSNHQTYFADVIAFYHIFSSVKWGFKNSIRFPVYLLAPRAKSYYIAASETMEKGGVLPKLFSYGGAIKVERSWRANGANVKRTVDKGAEDKVNSALQHGWVVSFPQGTTSPYAPIRKGTGFFIKKFQPIVIPVVINGFRRAFDKKGLFFKKRNTTLSVRFKPPVHIDYKASVEEIVKVIEREIEQEVIEDKNPPK